MQQKSTFRKINGSLVVGTVLAIVLAVGATGAAELPFGSRVDMQSSANGVSFPIDLATGDMNDDGIPDLVMCDQSSGYIWRIVGFANGFSVGISIASGLDSPRAVDVGDIDGDGDLDVIVGQYNNIAPGGQAEIIWYERLSNGSWDAHDTYFLSYTGVRSIKLADIDLDGDLDYVLAAEGSPDHAYSSLSWRENSLSDTGTAGFSGTHHNLGATVSRPWDVEIADLDRDGDPDIVAADTGNNTVAWYENDGTPDSGWTEHVLINSFEAASSVSIGDIDRDGEPDIVALGAAENQIVWFENGTWTEHNVVLGIDGPTSVETGDMDLDGDLDLVVTREFGNEVLWIENRDGDGGLWQSRSVDASFGGAVDALPVDLDGDGDLDIAAVGYTADAVSKWENQNTHRRFAEADPITIRDELNNPRGVATADINGDGLKDVVLGGWGDAWVRVYLQLNETAWWENTVDTGTSQFRDVSVADIDGDGDLDILGATLAGDAVYWWANDGTTLPSWTRTTVLSSFNGAHAVEPVDIDGDGDLDVAIAAFDDDVVKVLTNDDGVGGSWSSCMTNTIDGAYDLAVGDLNDDGRPDIIASGYYGDFIRVMKQAGSGWSAGPTITGIDGPRGVALGDVDGDGDLDIVAAIRDDDDILWFENDGDGETWTAHDVGTGYLEDGSSVQAVDVDNDGDVDVVATGYGGGDVYLWKNDGDGASWVRRKIESSIDSPWQALADDLNGDSNMDLVLTAAGTTDSLTWYKNIGAQFVALAYDYAPARIEDGEKDAVFNFVVMNNGRAGDHDLEVSQVQLYFEDTAGNPLTSSQINDIVDRMEIYLDADDDLWWTEGADTLLATDTYLSLVGGTLTLDLSHGISGNSVAPTVGEGFFVVFQAASDASEQALKDIRVTFLTDQLGCDDAVAELPLLGEPAEDVTTGTISFGNMLFGDDFESGDLSAWSSVSP